MSTKKETLIKLYKKYGLEKEDTFNHAHYTILTRRDAYEETLNYIGKVLTTGLMTKEEK